MTPDTYYDSLTSRQRANILARRVLRWTPVKRDGDRIAYYHHGIYMRSDSDWQPDTYLDHAAIVVNGLTAAEYTHWANALIHLITKTTGDEHRDIAALMAINWSADWRMKAIFTTLNILPLIHDKELYDTAEHHQ